MNTERLDKKLVNGPQSCSEEQSSVGERIGDSGSTHGEQPLEPDKESRARLAAVKYLFVVAGIFVISAIVALPLIYHLLAQYGGPRGDGLVPADIKAMGSKDLVALLSSRNALAVAYAVEELGNRDVAPAVSQLIKKLNYGEWIQIPGVERSTSLARLSEDAIGSITRRQIDTYPGNIALLRPLFVSARKGTLAERVGALTILGRLREPLAVPLISETADHGDGPLRDAAAKALAQSRLPTKDETVSEVLDRTATWYLAGLCIIIAAAVGITAARIWRRTPITSVLLLCIPLVLMIWITALTANVFSISIVVDGAIDEAVREEDLMSLKAMLYDEIVTYPGDSYVAQYLVDKGSDRVVYCLVQLPSVGPDDAPQSKKFLRKRADWILSRIVAQRLSNGTLDGLIDSNVPAVRTALVGALGKLGVRNDAVLQLLERLCLDSEDAIRVSASKALALVKKYPAWIWWETLTQSRNEAASSPGGTPSDR